LLVAVPGRGSGQVAHVLAPHALSGRAVERDDGAVVLRQEQPVADDDRRELEQYVRVEVPAGAERRADGRLGRQVAPAVARVAVLGPLEAGERVDLLV